MLDFVKKEHSDQLLGYPGNDVGTILGLLHRFENLYNETEPHHRKRRHLETELYDMLSLQLFSSLAGVQQAYTSDYSNVDSNPSSSREVHGTQASPEVLTLPLSVAGQQKQVQPYGAGANHDYMRTTLRLLADNIRLRNDIAKLYKGIQDVNNQLLEEEQEEEDNEADDGDLSAFNNAVDTRSKRNTQEYTNQNEHHVMDLPADGKTKVRHQHGKLRHDNADNDDVSSEHIVHDDVTDTMVYANVSHDNDSLITWQIYFSEHAGHHESHSEKLLEIAHILHYCSIAILGIFVAQVRMHVVKNIFGQMDVFPKHITNSQCKLLSLVQNDVNLRVIAAISCTKQKKESKLDYKTRDSHSKTLHTKKRKQSLCDHDKFKLDPLASFPCFGFTARRD